MPSESNEEWKARIIQMTDERGDFGPLEDGYIYYFPSGNGALSSHELRVLADELDKRNKPWDEEIRRYFDAQSTKSTDDANSGDGGQDLFKQV